jgi:predicted DNA-binding protein
MKVRKNFTLDKELTDKLKDLSVQTKVPMSPLIEEGIEEILSKYERKGLYNGKKNQPR